MSHVREPRVSVIIPVYNAMPYLTATLRSVLAQDLAEIEVVAVNDGSTDGSGAELDRFAQRDHRLVVVHQPNSGWPGAPRNRGIERARGDYLFFMDADDTMAPHALHDMVRMAEARAADIVIPRLEGTGGRRVQSLFRRHPAGEMSIARAMETLSPQKLFSRALIERAGLRFPEERVRLEDGIFVARAYTRASRILLCGAGPLYFIALRDDGQNISSRAIDPVNYVASCRRIAAILSEGTPDPTAAQRLVLQFFQRKGLRFYAPHRWGRMSLPTRETWVTLHREFLRDFAPPAGDARIAHPTDRRKLALIRAGDVVGLTALIAAEPECAHAARVVEARGTERGTELTLAAVPSVARGRLVRGIPGPARQRAVRRLDRVARAFGGSRAARGLNRRVAAGLTSGAPRVWLILGCRRRDRTVALAGRLVGYDPDAGALSYAFVLSPELLRGFGNDRVDLWTVAGTADGASGARVRLSASERLDAAGAAEHLYATAHGNASLRAAG
ncbi:glycosyltransferase family 2 protein [Leucobacter luti]|uniref:Glycosyl transferase family 2 n=1 Tax=Leucobacter luti TaxID=340320 RepID=A0A4Q7U0P5_9MICO|nr:glycosyltransferase family 2 protein [Leucobacter luti]MBL3699434.1 glycosyltransferase family 2 protein [Leucobacter luti]RZT66944.1 glycosyl transferase family 2 [Leucobacter luti]